MNSPLISCSKCKTSLAGEVYNLPQMTPCPACDVPLQVEIFPAFFRRIAPGRDGEALLEEVESSCIYHPQKKAVVPCEACGRFLCALCEVELDGKHLCPACLESGKKKKTIHSLEDMRMLYNRQALVLAVLPLFITGLAAIY